MAEDVGVRVGDGPNHPLRHLVPRHTQLGMDGRDHDVQLFEQLWLLVQRAVLVDVDLDPGEDPEGRQPLVQLSDNIQLLSQAFRGQPVCHGQVR